MDGQVAVLGLGLMGRPVARRLQEAGWQVRGWNRSPLPPDLSAGISLVPSLADAARAPVCLLLLADSAAVDEVLAALRPHLRPGHLVVDMGTSDPARSRDHALRLAAVGVGWVDAPVSGGPEGAARGSLAIMAGGTDADVARARPILEALGRVVHVGPAGAGHTCKLVNQVIVGLTIGAVAEALTLAERSGVDPRVVQKALAGGFADSRILQVHGSRMVARAYIPGGRARTQLKDLLLAQALAREHGVRLPHLDSAVELYRRVVERGWGDLDHSVVHRLLWEQAE
ncbi:MAG: NAD(P)-dependent oxidoreductase [Armatimonadota bacterium]|nr:NAD(P)-dependent oxidoreductase [Armatimonadota bacterium]MDR7438121.1 NAD(P)-dependent oxidoreductase [Armatimonadota bacterium]MDR7472219.1 NAD(P)-dependent oxidoreductase [Armatimonadota bacterium]MDR7507720.1 NAD(P)-dependent oxidoreductase [Armatimonadota bacterium]MDR7559660.1 NAD(P)-dependent oxidoreductase [Armatimonadota bacterium]